MPRHSDTSSDNQAGRALTNQAAPKNLGSAAPSFVDNRPQAIAQRTLHAMMQQGAQGHRLAQLRDQINSSPRQVAQRKQLLEVATRSTSPTPPSLQRTERAAHAGGNTVLQMKGVGGQKIGFKRKNDKEDQEAWDKLEQCWRVAKAKRQEMKEKIEQALPGKAGKGGFTKYYAEELDKIKDERDLLLDELRLVTTEPTVNISATNVITVLTGGDKGLKTEKVIGEVITDTDKLYVQSAAASKTTRETFKKQNPLDEKNGEKEYIKDSRGVYTRRFAYHEMNYHQMMDFVMSGEVTGRYQMFMSAGEAASTSPQKIVHPGNKAAVTRRKAVQTGADLTWEEVAVLHQWKGSGPYQSGVSLTSTSREEVRSNKGDRFKSAGGFRLKIDLAKVAADIPIINDYSAGGVSQSAEKTTNIRPDKYEFPESATKNRELYIERVTKAWVVEVVHHGANEVVTTFPEIEEAVRGDVGAKDTVKGIGIQAYITGFEEGMKGNDYTAGGKEGSLGVQAGKNALAGYGRGSSERLKQGGVASAVDALKEQATYEQKKVPAEHKYDAHKIGYMRGRCTTKPMFASAAEYGAAISE